MYSLTNTEISIDIYMNVLLEYILIALLEFILTALLEYIDILIWEGSCSPAHTSLKDGSKFYTTINDCYAVLLLLATT